MTEEERDQLASAYIDGEATPQEVALVERDSDLQLRVQKLQTVASSLGSSIAIPSGLKERHLAAALAQFDPSQSMGGGSTTADELGPDTLTKIDESNATSNPTPREGGENVIDFASRRTESTPTLSDKPMTTVTSRSMPQWLSAAAVTLCVLGGGVWLASQMGSSEDSFETAEVAADFDESADADTATASDDANSESGEDFAEESGEESAEGAAAAAQSTTTISERAFEEEEAMEDEEEALEDEGAETEATTVAEPEQDVAADDDEAATDSQETGASGFFPDEPVASFGETPNTADLIEAPPAPPRVDLEQSQCVNEINRPVQVTGYLPIEVGGEPAEFFIFVNENGDEDGIVLDADCQPLT